LPRYAFYLSVFFNSRRHLDSLVSSFRLVEPGAYRGRIRGCNGTNHRFLDGYQRWAAIIITVRQGSGEAQCDQLAALERLLAIL
jgi:hypothetical protein